MTFLFLLKFNDFRGRSTVGKVQNSLLHFKEKSTREYQRREIGVFKK